MGSESDEVPIEDSDESLLDLKEVYKEKTLEYLIIFLIFLR